MNNYTRYDYTPFASAASNNGQFGSAYNGNPTMTSDIGQIQALPNYSQGWAMAQIGQDIKAPTLEEMQGLQYMTSYGVSYLMQKGIPEWSAGTTYFYGDLCASQRMIWRCLADSVQSVAPSVGDDYYSVFSVSNVSAPLANIFQDSGVYLAIFYDRNSVYYSTDRMNWTAWNPKNFNNYGDDMNLGGGALDPDNHCAYFCGYHISGDNAKRQISLWRFDFVTKTFTTVYSQRVEGRVNYCRGVALCGNYLVVYGYQPANARLKQLTVFTKTGTFVGQWGISWSGESDNNGFMSLAYDTSTSTLWLTDAYSTNGTLFSCAFDASTGQISSLQRVSTGLSAQFTDIIYVSSSNLLVASTVDGRVVVSDDHGSTWSALSGEAGQRINKLYDLGTGAVYILCTDSNSYIWSIDSGSEDLYAARFGNVGIPIASITVDVAPYTHLVGARDRGWIFGYDSASTMNAWEPMVLQGNNGRVRAISSSTSVVFAEAFSTVCVDLTVISSSGAAVTPTSRSATGFTIPTTANTTYYYTAKGW